MTHSFVIHVRNIKKKATIILTVVTRCNAVLCLQTCQRDVENYMQQQEGKAGEAQRL